MNYLQFNLNLFSLSQLFQVSIYLKHIKKVTIKLNKEILKSHFIYLHFPMLYQFKNLRLRDLERNPANPADYHVTFKAARNF